MLAFRKIVTGSGAAVPAVAGSKRSISGTSAPNRIAAIRDASGDQAGNRYAESLAGARRFAFPAPSRTVRPWSVPTTTIWPAEARRRPGGTATIGPLLAAGGLAAPRAGGVAIGSPSPDDAPA